MRQIEELNEHEIQNALKEGLITVKEAREMLMVYIQKSNIIAMQSASMSTPTISNTHRL